MELELVPDDAGQPPLPDDRRRLDLTSIPSLRLEDISPPRMQSL